MVRIEEISYGIAFTVTDGNKKWIQLNKHLKEYPKLYKSTLAHEMQHIHSKNKYIDFWIDFKQLFSLKHGWEVMKFSIRHPKALMANSPVFYENKRWSVNWFMVAVNSVLILGVIGGIILI